MNTSGTKAIRLLVVDDYPAVRRCLSTWLSLEPDLEIVGEAGSGAEVVSLAETLRPDVVLMDVEMPGMSGIETIERLRASAPTTAVVILTLRDDAATRARARVAGAAFVAKHKTEEELLAEIRRAVMAPGGK